MSFVVVTLKNTQAKAETKVQTAQLYCQALRVKLIMRYTQILVLVYIYALFLFNVKNLHFTSNLGYVFSLLCFPSKTPT